MKYADLHALIFGVTEVPRDQRGPHPGICESMRKSTSKVTGGAVECSRSRPYVAINENIRDRTTLSI